MRESAEAATVREAKLKLLQKHYANFATFLRDMMAVLGFSPTWMQYDIGNYLQFGPQDLMVQAQRGEAKSTITAIFAVWSLIHDPKHRVLIVSAGGKQANEIATLVQRLIMTVPALACMRPDKNNGDRTSVEAFDIHYSLKGIDKSPSVACIGITGNLPGKRADLLIADDIESPKNSMNAGNRELVLTLSREFSAICTGRPGVPARIVYLGTPQTSESIYNTLPGRGFAVRIWPGRYPTPAERDNYGTHLAPSLVNRMEADPSLCFGGGPLQDMGQPTDPVLFDEDKLQSKQKKDGLSYFMLQYMLSTKLMDALRFPLKPEQLVVLPGSGAQRFPLVVTRGFGGASTRSFTSSGLGFNMMAPHEVSQETADLSAIHMQVDPAGGGANADETGYAVTGFLNGNVYVLACGGVPGGYDEKTLKSLAEIAVKYKPNVITVEKNMGHGAFTKVWLPILRREGWKGNIEDVFVSGQKEARIIGTLEPLMGRGSLIFLESVVEEDDQATERYSASGKRQVYSLFFQMMKVTKQRGCLAHDDRLDALEGSVRHWLAQLATDQKKVIEHAEKKAWEEWFNDPTGMLRQTRNSAAGPRKRGSMLNNRY